MIEKIRTTEQGLYNEHGTFLGTMPKDTDSLTLANKINELVDAVNELQEMCKSCDNQIGILAEQIAKLQHDNSEKTNCQENVQGEFAEQRKWIGKICKFWDYDGEEKWFSILEYIDKNSPYPYCASGDWWYKHCEPVKPDDDIIYKGE